jgi:hypothetical protein
MSPAVLRASAAVLLALAIASCRTTAPTGTPIAPLTATTEVEAMTQLTARREAFRGVRSLMRVRATTAGRTQSFRAQLAVLDRTRMELIAYTPVGTTALTLRADGDQVSLKNHMEGNEWEGNAADLARSIGFLGSSLIPAEVAMLIVGIPPRDDLHYELTAAGLRSAETEGMSVTFDPPRFPARNVVIVRGADRVEIEHLEIVETSH